MARRHDPRDLDPSTLLPAIATWLRPELPGLSRADLGVMLLDSGEVELDPEDVVAAALEEEVI